MVSQPQAKKEEIITSLLQYCFQRTDRYLKFQRVSSKKTLIQMGDILGVKISNLMTNSSALNVLAKRVQVNIPDLSIGYCSSTSSTPSSQISSHPSGTTSIEEDSEDMDITCSQGFQQYRRDEAVRDGGVGWTAAEIEMFVKDQEITDARKEMSGEVGEVEMSPEVGEVEMSAEVGEVEVSANMEERVKITEGLTKEVEDLAAQPEEIPEDVAGISPLATPVASLSESMLTPGPESGPSYDSHLEEDLHNSPQQVREQYLSLLNAALEPGLLERFSFSVAAAYENVEFQVFEMCPSLKKIHYPEIMSMVASEDYPGTHTLSISSCFEGLSLQSLVSLLPDYKAEDDVINAMIAWFVREHNTKNKRVMYRYLISQDVESLLQGEWNALLMDNTVKEEKEIMKQTLRRLCHCWSLDDRGWPQPGEEDVKLIIPFNYNRGGHWAVSNCVKC